MTADTWEAHGFDMEKLRTFAENALAWKTRANKVTLERLAQLMQALGFAQGHYAYNHVRKHDKVGKKFQASDIDLFLVTRDPTEAVTTITKLHERLVELTGSPVKIYRSEHATTFIPAIPFRRVQVIQRLYYSPEHVLLGFDIDCCCVAYHNLQLIAMPNAVRALALGQNLVDTSRQSSTFETRLLKYAERGFAIAIPGFEAETRAANIAHELCEMTSTVEFRGVDKVIATILSGVMKHEKVRVWNKLAKIPKSVNCDYDDFNAASHRNETNVDTDVLFKHPTLGPITFVADNPHKQGRTDVLFTGSFNPTESDWYGRARASCGARLY
jgi:hypothetical protein